MIAIALCIWLDFISSDSLIQGASGNGSYSDGAFSCVISSDIGVKVTSTYFFIGCAMWKGSNDYGMVLSDRRNCQNGSYYIAEVNNAAKVR